MPSSAKNWAFIRKLTKIVEENPPLPLLPKSSNYHGDSPRSGGNYYLLKLIKFRGKDLGKSKMDINDTYERVVFPTNVTSLRQVFTVFNELDKPKKIS